jgi:hypothetical protein
LEKRVVELSDFDVLVLAELLQMQQMTWRPSTVVAQFARCRDGEVELFGRH